MEDIDLLRFNAWWAAGIAAMLGKLLWALLSAETLSALMREDGWVESLTLVLYGVAFAAVAIAPGSEKQHWYVARVALMAVLLGLGAREWDAHIRLTGTSVLHVSYYLNAPLSDEKVWALCAIALFAASVVCLMWHYARVLRTPSELSNTVRSTVIAFVATAVFAKVLDRTVNILAQDFDWLVPTPAAMLMLSIEETLELALPLIVRTAVWQHARRVVRPSPGREPVGETAQHGSRVEASAQFF